MITIREWMNNKTILITGGAGFLGKVLTEKLLRTCPGVKRIYLIIRSKRGKTPQERWNEIAKDALFETVLADTPDIMDQKVTVLDGDMSLINLGLSQEIIEELKNTVNIIFHSAATVRFNDPLHKAFLSNTRGTLEMCKLASETKNLEVFVHVSTAYCNHHLMETCFEEKIYEPCQDWRTILKLIETENPVVMNTISYKIIQDHPNTYTFSKSLSEKIVEEYSCKFSTVIARPGVVVGIFKDLILGWTDNVNGVLGISTALTKGVMRVIKGNEECCLDYIPADFVINALIVSSWEKATGENKELSIYNCSYSNELPKFNLKALCDVGLEVNKEECTLDNDIWYPFLIFVTNDIYFHFLFYILQVIPAGFLDSILFLLNKKRRLIKLNIKIYQVSQALVAFTTKTIVFDNKKYKALWNKLSLDEAEIYPLRPPSDFNYREIMITMHKGVKKYFLKENLEDEEYHTKKLMRLYYLHQFAKGIIISATFMLSYKLINAAIYTYIL
ncbi:unnamed protein product [Nezara viridula]|uniref:Fatty acyl-CoA reductase n=1 Tax=Nezara viridula TaxID=85310 RepID=A0A9P0H9E8_NEZVI|nr:unnamed protein product [Nezara viridula]